MAVKKTISSHAIRRSRTEKNKLVFFYCAAFLPPFPVLSGGRSRRRRGLLDRRREWSGGLRRGENNAEERRKTLNVFRQRAEPHQRGLRGVLVVTSSVSVSVLVLVLVRVVVPIFFRFLEGGGREGEEKERRLRKR